MIKNLTSRQVTLSLTIGMVILNFALLLVFDLLKTKGIIGQYSWITITIYSIVFFILSYLLVRWLLNQFIFEKIKLIYKIIGAAKKDVATQSKQSFSTTSIDEVNIEVAQWAENTSKEISSLKSLEEYRKQYVGVISHELKTPIFTIQGYIHTLLEGGLYDEQINRKYLQRAAKNIDRLETIVEDLELINNLESGQNELILTNFDLGQLIKEVLEDLKSFADEKFVKMEYKDGSSNKWKVKADIDSIRQVLINLITNSIKYGKEEGHTEINAYQLGDKVLIEVSDNGLGIDEIHLKHLFDRFYRVDPSRSRILGGSGLGLSIVKHIMEAHNESINVRSTPGKGTTFGFTLKLS